MIDSCHNKLSIDQYYATILRAQVRARQGYELLVHRLDSGLRSRYFCGGEGRSTRQGKLSGQINPWRVVDFSSDIFLVLSSLGKSLISWLGLLRVVC